MNNMVQIQRKCISSQGQPFLLSASSHAAFTCFGKDNPFICDLEIMSPLCSSAFVVEMKHGGPTDPDLLL